MRTGSSVGGSTRAAHAERAPQLVERLGQPRALGQPPRPPQADREVAVAEVEPDVLAELPQRVHDRERVAARCPSRARRCGRPASRGRGRGRARRSRRGPRRRRPCWRSPRGPRRPRRASRARASRRPCRRPAGPRGSSRRQRNKLSGHMAPTRVRIREVGPRDGFQNEPEIDPHRRQGAAHRPARPHRPEAPRGHELRARRRDPAARRRRARCSTASTRPTTSRSPS